MKENERTTMRMRRLSTIACLMAIGVIALVCLSPAEQTAPVTGSRSVAQIAQDRVDLAAQGYDLELKRYQRGLTTEVSVGQWLRRRAQAALDLPEGARKTEILRDYLADTKKQVAQLERSMQAGTAGVEDLMLAKDRALEAELWLAKESK